MVKGETVPNCPFLSYVRLHYLCENGHAFYCAIDNKRFRDAMDESAVPTGPPCNDK
jgi:hypothetical protein